MFDYYNAMDRNYGSIAPSGNPSRPDKPVEVGSLTPTDIGTSTNPMMHQVQAFAAKIREGASRIELSFLGAGKSNSQQPSPEAFGAKEREDIRSMAKINKIQTSTHAALHGESLAGLGREGFSGEARQHALKEIERAIHFAADATRGGAIVFHTGEWMRPMSEIGKAGQKPMFKSFDEEDLKAPKIIVSDDRTGEITAVRKDHRVYEPKFYTAEEYEKVIGEKLVGKKDENGNTIEADDWVDLQRNAIKKTWLVSNDSSKIERLFDRIPIFDEKNTNFRVDPVEFKDFEKLAADISKKTGETILPEILFFRTQLANQVSQAKGQSLYHAKEYAELREKRNALQKAMEFYEKLEDSVPEADKWRLMKQKNILGPEFTASTDVLTSTFLKDALKKTDDQMRYIHETSSVADTQAKQTLERIQHIKPIEEYGLQQTANTIARAGLMAMTYYDKNKKDLDEKIFVAPENWRPEQYGSHPDEIRNIITKSREEMAKRLQQQYGKSKEEAKQLAADHIRATIDIGHFNLWRQHFQVEPGTSTEERDKKFNKWVTSEMEKLAKEGMIGHLHIADNFGFDDEHLTPGQGNAPIKEFIKIMKDNNLNDFIVEAGSYNGSTTMQDTWALMGSPVYAAGGGGTPMSFRGIRDQQFGYHNPSTYIVGAYAPSNEWHLWSEIPFE